MPTTNTRFVDVDAEAGGNGTTNGLTGGTCAYKSLSIWEAARDDVGDLVTNDTIEKVVCGSNHASSHTADSTYAAIAGWTTSDTQHIVITTDAASRAGATWNTSKYRLSVATNPCLAINEDYVRVSNLQAEVTSTSANYHNPINCNSQVASNEVWVSNCLLKCSGGTTNREMGIYTQDSDINLYVWNTVIYNCGAGANNYFSAIYITCTTANIYNCTAIGGHTGMRVVAGTVACKNTYVHETGAGVCFSSGGTLTCTNCASSDATADDFGGSGNLVSIGYSTTADSSNAGFTNIGAGTENYTPKAGGALADAGLTISESEPLNYTDDLTGYTRA